MSFNLEENMFCTELEFMVTDLGNIIFKNVKQKGTKIK